jgi:hypothetical protein
MGHYLSTRAAANTLSAFAYEETAAMLECMSSLGQCLNSLQKARCLVESYPNFPDLLCLMRFMVDAGATDAAPPAGDTAAADVKQE